jgi:proline iminopeptidase
MHTYYPEIEPYDSGMLDVGDGQHLYWEASGNPTGKPVVFLHGGPGAEVSPRHRRAFDPAKYRIILFDQRGSGKSRPHASDPGYNLAVNTTWHLVADIETLREHFGIDRWQVFGGSWGSTLALAYAQTHPTRVTELVLRGIFTLRKSELDWFYEGPAGQVFPEVWEQYEAQIPLAERGNFIEAYHRRLNDPDPAVHEPAAVAWATWESSAITLLPNPEVVQTFTDPHFALAFARIENHYFMNKGWMEDGQLIARAHLLRGIPTVIVQGRYDMCTPPVTAWDLHRALPEAEFVMIPDAGHSFDEPGILSALIEATDRFAV